MSTCMKLFAGPNHGDVSPLVYRLLSMRTLPFPIFPKPQDPVAKNQVRGAFYSISCNDREKSYISETKRHFASRLKGHKKQWNANNTNNQS